MKKTLLVSLIIIFGFTLPIIQPFSALGMKNFVYEIKVSSIRFSNANVQEELVLQIQDRYHNLSEVYSELEYFNETAPGLIDYTSIGKSYYNNSIPLITVTNENIPKELKGETYVVAHHHAREQITIEHALRTIRDLVNGYGVDEEITSLLDKYIIYFIVTLNPDTLDYVLYENEWQRKTLRPYDDDGDGLVDEDGPEDIDGDGRISEYAARKKSTGEWFYYYEGIDNDGDGALNEDRLGGVDLNRNYPFHWNDNNTDTGCTTDKSSYTWQGPEPASESETKALISFVEGHNFTHALSLHSGTNATLFDWSYTSERHQPEANIYEEIIYTMQIKKLLPDSFFKEENDVTYTCAGEWGDWSYGTQHTIPMTLEIYHQEGSGYYHWKEDNGTHEIWEFNTMKEYFNPDPEKIDDLHNDLADFEIFWLSLTPSIVLKESSNKTLSNGDVELDFFLTSSSRYFNTTDNAKVSISTDDSSYIESYTNELGTLLPYKETKLTVILAKDIPDDFEMNITISSNWASDLVLHVSVSPDNVNKTTSFDLYLSIFALITIVPLIRKKFH